MYWSPHFTYIEKRRNRHLIDDPTVGFYQRLVTFEDMERYTITEPTVPTQITDALQSACNAIASSIMKQSGGHILLQSLVLVFKQDSQDKFWLLYCLGIKLELSGDQPVSVYSYDELRLTVPDAIKTQTFNQSYPESQAYFKNCNGCQNFAAALDFYGVEVDYLQRHASHLSKEIVERLLSVANMSSFDSSPTYTGRGKVKASVDVCIDCYMALTRPKTRQSVLPPSRPLMPIIEKKLPKFTQSVVTSPKARSQSISVPKLPSLPRNPKPKCQVDPTPTKSMNSSVHSSSYLADKMGLMNSTYKTSYTQAGSPMNSTGYSTPSNRSSVEHFDFMLATIQKLKALSRNEPST